MTSSAPTKEPKTESIAVQEAIGIDPIDLIGAGPVKQQNEDGEGSQSGPHGILADSGRRAAGVAASPKVFLTDAEAAVSSAEAAGSRPHP